MERDSTALEVADVLDAAHDAMLVRGRCTATNRDKEGRVCLYGAVSLACPLDRPHLWRHTVDTLRSQGFNSCWNMTASDDEALDAFRITSKMLRNGELEVA